MKEIEALACIRRILKDEILKIEDQIKSLAGAGDLTQVKYQTLYTRVWLYGDRKAVAVVRESLFKVIDKAVKDLTD